MLLQWLFKEQPRPYKYIQYTYKRLQKILNINATHRFREHQEAIAPTLPPLLVITPCVFFMSIFLRYDTSKWKWASNITAISKCCCNHLNHLCTCDSMYFTHSNIQYRYKYSWGWNLIELFTLDGNYGPKKLDCKWRESAIQNVKCHAIVNMTG